MRLTFGTKEKQAAGWMPTVENYGREEAIQRLDRSVASLHQSEPPSTPTAPVSSALQEPADDP